MSAGVRRPVPMHPCPGCGKTIPVWLKGCVACSEPHSENSSELATMLRERRLARRRAQGL